MDVKKSPFYKFSGFSKSTVAKVNFGFMWLEKSIVRGDLPEDLNSYKGLDDILRFHRIENYLKDNTKLVIVVLHIILLW